MKKALLITFYLLSFQVLLAQNSMYVNSSNGLNLREGPGTGYNTTANIPHGSRIDLISTEGDWAKVKYEAKEGYVSRQYLTENKPGNNSTSQGSNNSGAAAKKNNGSVNRHSASSSYANDRNWGMGLRLGDPSGLTVKKYLSGGKALEFNLGTTSYWGYDYRDHFYEEDRYADYEYLNYRRKGAVAFQVHYLFQKDIRDIKDLQWYWGFGGQIRSKSYQYNYRYRNYYGRQGDYNWVYASDKVTDFDLGADILIGLEYHIPGAPLSVFMDANLMLELLDNPFALYPQGGIGIRYNFK